MSSQHSVAVVDDRLVTFLHADGHHLIKIQDSVGATSRA